MVTAQLGYLRRVTLVSVMVFGCAASAAAQEVASTFDQLRVLIKAGDSIKVTDTSGQERSGRLAELTSSSLTLLVREQPWKVGVDDVSLIRHRGGDSLRNGALVGLAIGGGLGAYVAAAVVSDGEYTGIAVAAVGFYAGLGAAVGTGVDALITSERTIFARVKPSALRVSPFFTARSKGLSVSVTF